MAKSLPMRQCLGCRTMMGKRELMRVVRSPEGEVSIDFKGKKPGRGAYLCPKAECFGKAKKSRALQRALKTDIPDEVFEALENELENRDG